MTLPFPRRFILAAVFAVALAAACGAGARAQDARIAFVSGIEDLPLMPGLEEVDETTMVFDTPAGRIVEALARGRLDRDQVVGFYAATLPQLGWTPAGETLFRREGEILELHIADAPVGAGHLTVRFALAPAK
jgi:hypothetical protein